MPGNAHSSGRTNAREQVGNLRTRAGIRLPPAVVVVGLGCLLQCRVCRSLEKTSFAVSMRLTIGASKALTGKVAIAWPRSIGPWLNRNNPTKSALLLWLRCGLRSAPCDIPRSRTNRDAHFDAASKLIWPRPFCQAAMKIAQVMTRLLQREAVCKETSVTSLGQAPATRSACRQTLRFIWQSRHMG